MRTVDISSKPETLRRAVAHGRIKLKPETIRAIKEVRVPKGDVLSSCRLAGIFGAKKTPDLLPFCHPVSIDAVEVWTEVGEDYIEVFSSLKGTHRTGYEMEALTAVSVALLTIYDMCKALDESMVIERIELLEKTGGKSQWSRNLEGVKVKVLSKGEPQKLIEEKLTALGAVLSEDCQLLVSTKLFENMQIWGISYAINQKLFSLIPESFKEGVKVGLLEGKVCIQIQEDIRVVEAFFESFGSMIGNWINGRAL